MSDARDDIEPQDDGAAGEAAEVIEQPQRPDPRLRPPDPAGTQPKWDPDALLPQEKPPAAHDRLWSAPGEETEDDREVTGTGVAAAAAETEAEADEAPSSGHRHSRYSGRFSFMLGALLACGVAAVALLVAALVGGSSSTRTITLKSLPAWSKWHPTAATGTEAAQQIAEHVGQQYHLPDGEQLVIASGGPVSYGGFPASIVIRQSLTQGGGYDMLDGVGVQYRLCGVDPKALKPSRTRSCAITVGRPSESRALLLNREALELALYSFRYLGVTQTVVLMPPSSIIKRDPITGQKTRSAPTQAALLFRREAPGVATAITRPLDDTLSTVTPTVSNVEHSVDSGAVRSLTSGTLFQFSYTLSAADGSAYLLLQPPIG